MGGTPQCALFFDRKHFQTLFLVAFFQPADRQCEEMVEKEILSFRHFFWQTIKSTLKSSNRGLATKIALNLGKPKKQKSKPVYTQLDFMKNLRHMLIK